MNGMIVILLARWHRSALIGRHTGNATRLREFSLPVFAVAINKDIYVTQMIFHMEYL